jgi:septal ring factor EnvC (AmiA/AmiB activator)
MDSNDYIEFEGVRRYQPDALHKRMAARIAALETELIEAATKADYWRGEHDTAAFQLQDARANIAELEAQLQALSVMVDGQNRKLKILLAAAAARGDGFGPVPAQPTDGMSYMERQALLDTDVNEV